MVVQIFATNLVAIVAFIGLWNIAGVSPDMLKDDFKILAKAYQYLPTSPTYFGVYGR